MSRAGALVAVLTSTLASAALAQAGGATSRRLLAAFHF
jgi:hypothetical protein